MDEAAVLRPVRRIHEEAQRLGGLISMLADYTKMMQQLHRTP